MREDVYLVSCASISIKTRWENFESYESEDPNNHVLDCLFFFVFFFVGLDLLF